MPKLILIKHSEPDKNPLLQVNDGVLSEEGKIRCEVLGNMLGKYNLDRMIASVEPKAY